MALTKPTNSLVQLGVVTKYELLRHLRRRRLIAVVAIATLVGALYLLLPPILNYEYPDKVEEFASRFLEQVDVLIITAGAFFAGDAVSSEFEKKTGFIIFPNPVRRSVLVFGKFAAAFISVAMVVLFYYSIAAASTIGIYGEVPAKFADSLLYALLYVGSVVGFTLLCSSLVRGSMGATLLSFFTLFLIMPIASVLLMLAGVEPWFLPTYASGIITEAINPPTSRKVQIGPVTVYHPSANLSILVMADYLLLPLALSVYLASRREME